jgi:hypothetical protein
VEGAHEQLKTAHKQSGSATFDLVSLALLQPCNGTLYEPTFTDVFPSSSDALLPPPILLLMLIRLELLGGRNIALIGRCGPPGGEPGGELAMALSVPLEQSKPVPEDAQSSTCRRRYYSGFRVRCGGAMDPEGEVEWVDMQTRESKKLFRLPW